MTTAALGGGGEGNGNTGEGGTGGNTSAGGSGAPGGASTASWRDALPEDIRDNASLKSFTDVGNLAKSFIHAQSQIGKKGAIVPQWDRASETEVTEFYKAIGVPALDKYEVPLPKDFTPATGVIDKFKELAVKNGLLPKQAGEVISFYSQFDTESKKAAADAKLASDKAGIAALQKEWGEGYDKEVKTARFGIKQLFGEEGFTHLDKLGVANDPGLIKAFAKAGKLYGEDKLLGEGIGSEALSKSDIQAQLDEIRANRKTNGFSDRTHPLHDVTMKKFENLAKRLTGGK